MKTKTTLKASIARLIAAGLVALAAQPAAAANVTISSTPLATAGGSSILPNLLFVLDASGSMDSDFLPDYVDDSGKCMTRSGGNTSCTFGEPPRNTGGVNGFNGVAYDPMLAYKPALKSDGKSVIGSATGAFGAALTITAVPNDAFGVQTFTSTGCANPSSACDITTGIQDVRYCNGNSVCKRNGADNAGTSLIGGNDDQGVTHPNGRFPYRTHASNSSTLIFGLPEMLPIGSFVRNSGTVTVTTIAQHGLTTTDRVYVDTGSTGTDVTCAAVTGATANTFTYTNGTGSTGTRSGGYRKCVNLTAGTEFVRAAGSNIVTVTSNAHGLANNDIVSVANTAGGAFNVSDVTISVVDANSFKYTSGATTALTSGGAWVRSGLYNARGTTNGAANSYSIVAVEYCTDANLSNCEFVAPGNTPSAGFTFPAPVRFCRTQEQALSPGAVSDSSGTPRCRGKFVGSGSTQWTWPRFGYFKRDIIQSGATFTRTSARTDCVGAPTCTYAEESQNYARWWAYYRTRMQMMKTASGRAFLPFISNPSATPAVPDKLRVGFITINPFYAIGSGTNSGSVQPNRWLKIDAFNTTQANSWYNMFYLQDPNQSTPLREALSRAGWIYAGKLGSGLTNGMTSADDPVQASCQRHFTLLTTDGYWNGNAGQNLQGGSIGNLDNANPTVDSGYSSPSVDRTSTGTFDGGKGTVVKVATPTETLEQVVCQAGNNTTFNGGTQTGCSCNTGEHRIKQRTKTSTQTVTSTDGVETGNSTVDVYTFQNITGCTNNFVVTTTTPNNRIEQQVCSGSNNTTFPLGGNVACGCPANQKRVKQQIASRNHIVVNTDGSVTSDTQSAFSFATSDITGCDAQVIQTTQISTHSQEVLCSANNTTSFSSPPAGYPNNQTACGCASGFKKIARRVETRTTVTTTIDGVAQTPSVTYGDVFSTPVACNATSVKTSRQNVTIAQTLVCSGTGGTGNFGDATSFTCNCNGSRRQFVRQTYLNPSEKITALTLDGVPQTVPQYVGTKIREFSVNGTTWQGSPFTGNSCSSSSLSSSGVETITGPGPTVTTSGSTITAANISQSPNPQLVNNPAGAPVVTGTTITLASASPVLSPNPQINDPSGPAVPSQTGTQLTIALTPNPSVPTVGASTTTSTFGGYPDTLADVAMYYYRTDLRGGTELFNNSLSTGPVRNLGGTGTTDVSANLVPAKSGAKDFATHQHMVTFAVGLADGLMRYQADYEGASTGDFSSIKNGTTDGCFWVSGTCNWPQPLENDASALDDLWHAAVNGRGQFYLALNADALSTGIQTALTAVNSQVAAAAASATSSPNVTQTDNQIFSTTYETNTWSGKVFAQTIDPDTGNVNATIQWQADQQLLGKVSASTDTRVIWTFDSTSGTLLKPFDWASLSTTEQAFFVDRCVPASTMTQCTGLSPAQLTIANDGSSLVGFLRGHLGNEATIFRDRTFIDIANNNAVVQTVLGDTISAKPAYLRRPQFNYADAVTPPYSTFLSSNQNRSPRVYVAANDGYLHAFHGDTGEEMWAYLPRFLMPGLYTLADTGYASLHRYFADGSPETGEVFDSTAGAWKSILIAGAAGGGRGYYALDITDPSNPKGLWEFCSDSTLCAISDADLGLTYGNPVIGKRALDGRWVVLLTSGLNNAPPGTGDGVGYFYVLDALTGAVLHKVATTAGSIATPSGLMKVSAFYDSALTDGTFRYAYAGDQLGNVWRLDTRTDPPTVLHIASLTDGSTPPRTQPITTRPSLTRLSGQRILYIGTGRYLGSPDLSDPGAASGIAWQQTLWAFKDKDSDYGNLRADTNLVRQSLVQATLGSTERTISANPVDWNTKDGWYVDFNPLVGGVGSSPGEGVNLVDPRLVLGTLVLSTNVPAAGGSSCSVGGSSFEYNFDFKTGAAVSTSAGGVVGRSLGGTITVGVAIVQLPSGAIKSISTGADTSKTTSAVNTSATGAAVRRFSYRVR